MDVGAYALTQEQMDALDANGKDELGWFRSIRKKYMSDTGLKVVNVLLLLFFYPFMILSGVTGVFFPCIWPNTVEHVLVTFIIVILLTVMHVSIKIAQLAISGVAAYPVQPKWMYLAADIIHVFVFIGAFTGYVLDLVYGLLPSPFLPMIASWWVAVNGMVNFDLVRRVLYELPDELGPIHVKEKRNHCTECLERFCLIR